MRKIEQVTKESWGMELTGGNESSYCNECFMGFPTPELSPQIDPHNSLNLGIAPVSETETHGKMIQEL